MSGASAQDKKAFEATVIPFSAICLAFLQLVCLTSVTRNGQKQQVNACMTTAPHAQGSVLHALF